MAAWQEIYTAKDYAMFDDPKRINSHFGLPLPNPSTVFSICLNEDGCSNVHEGTRKGRRHYFGNLVALRSIKKQYPDAWIWDERYRFNIKYHSKDHRKMKAQNVFVQKIGNACIDKILTLATKEGLVHDGKIWGFPDLAVFLPGEKIPWRFMEIKIVEKGDKLRDVQKMWLQLLSNVATNISAGELELVRSGS